MAAPPNNNQIPVSISVESMTPILERSDPLRRNTDTAAPNSEDDEGFFYTMPAARINNSTSTPGSPGNASAIIDVTDGPNNPQNRNQVRRNMFHLFRESSRGTRIYVMLFCSLALAQFAVGVTMMSLSFSRDETCRQPLEIYLCVYLFRLLFLVPLTVTFYLRRSALTALRQRQLEQGEPVTAIEPTELDRRNEQWRNFLDFFGTLWFALGNWWLFTETSCAQTAPYRYYTSLTFVLMGYIQIMFPVILIMAIIFCLPIVLIAVRIVQRVTGVNLMAGLQNMAAPNNPQAPLREALSETLISKIPARIYRLASPKSPTTATKSKESDARSIRSIPEEDANCTICLGDYEEGQELKRLPCRHHFHSNCVDEWLRLNKTCPLCVRDVEAGLNETSAPAAEPSLTAESSNNEQSPTLA